MAVESSFLLQGIIYLSAAIIAVPISKRIGLGSVLGYLLAGVAIGPWGFGLINEVETVLHFAEFGVVMMLFLIGLELNLAKLWQLRVPVFLLGGAQVLVTLLITWGLSLAFNLQWQIGLVAGMGVAMSSTAIAIQTLTEKNWLNLPSGKSAFAVLLFQDLAVIPLMLLLALIAPSSSASAFDLMAALKALGAVVAVVIGGTYLLRHALRYIANTGMREIFIAFALLLVLGVAVLMESVGLSMALGSFLAGVLLADSEYRQELELDIEPFKGLLLGLFFIAVGMSVDIGLLWRQPLLILGLAFGFVALKILVLFSLARLFKQQKADTWIFALTLSQIGEFAFVIFAAAQQQQIFDTQITNILNAIVAVSMLTTPLLLVLHGALLKRQQAHKPDAFEPIDVKNKIIVAGFGRVGQVVTRLLNGIGQPPTVIEQDPNQIELVRRFGFKAYYGDITRPDVLVAAGIANATLLVLAIDDMEDALKTAKYVRKNYPQVKILARARNRTAAFEFMAEEIDSVRETFHSALSLGEKSLQALGFGVHQANKIAWQFKQHDEANLIEAFPHRHDQNQLVAVNHKAREDLEALLRAEQEITPLKPEDTWSI